MASSSEASTRPPLLLITVQQASAILWTTKAPQHAIRHLHQALLRDSVGSYSEEMSNIFLAIQGAALRQSNNSNDDIDNQDSSIEDLAQQWHVLEESLWAVAALARVCVGPAWWQQTLQRRRFRNSENNHPSSHPSATAEAAAANTNDGQRLPCRRQTTPTTRSDDGSMWQQQQQVEVATGEGSSSLASVNSSTTGNGTRASTSSSNHPDVRQDTQPQHQKNILMDHFVTEDSLPSGGGFGPVDEMLPASMLRFAVTAMEKASHILREIISVEDTTAHSDNASNNEEATKIALSLGLQENLLVEAQLVIVRQLCCCAPAQKAYYGTTGELSPPLQQWIIPGAHASVGQVLAHGLQLVCTGRSSSSSSSSASSNIEGLLAFVVTNHIVTPPAAASGNTTALTTKIKLPPTDKDQWKYILLMTRATTDLLSAGWRPLPRGREGADIVLALLVIASRGINLDDLTANDIAHETSAMESRKERLVASSCAAEALSALLTIANRGWVPLEHQATLVRTLCRLTSILRVRSIQTESNSVPVLPSNPSGNPEMRGEEEGARQVELFTSQRESCLISVRGLLWVVLSHEASVEASIAALFVSMETVTQAIGEEDSADSLLFKKLKWNDHTDDYVLADCANVVGAVSSVLWGAAPEFSQVAILRIYWQSAIEAMCNILSSVHSKFVVSETDVNNRIGGKTSLFRSTYFTKQVCPLLVDTIAALEKAIEVELRGDSGVFSSCEWEVMVDGIENTVLPWLSFFSQASYSNDNSDKTVFTRTNNQVQTGMESFLLRVAELLAYYVSLERCSLMDYSTMRRLILLLLNSSSPLGQSERQQLEVSAVHAWSKFGFFPYRLNGWKETSTEILQEAFSQNAVGKFLHSSPMRLEALESLTFEGTNAVESTGEAELRPLSLLVMTQYMPDLYSGILNESLLPILRLVLVEHSSTCSHLKRLNSSPDDIHRAQKSSDETNELAHYAVELAGRLFLNTLTDDPVRTELCSILKRSATLGPCSTITSSDVSVQVEASRQLYLCLRGLFCNLPSLHKHIPIIVGGVCEIFKTTLSRLIEDNDDAHFEETGAVCFGALRTLSRLQLRAKNRLAFRYEMTQAEVVNNEALGLPMENHGILGRVSAVAVSSFVQVGERNEEPAVSAKTRFSLQPITNELFIALRNIGRQDPGGSKAKDSLLASIRRSCLDVLSKLLIDGVTVEIPAENVCDVFCPSTLDAGVTSLIDPTLAVFKALSLTTQSVFACQGRPCGHGAYRLLGILAESIQSCTRMAAIAISRALFTILFSAEIASETIAVDDVYRILQDRLEVELLEFDGAGDNSRLVGSLLSVLNEALSSRVKVHPSKIRRDISSDMMRTFESCSSIISMTYLQPKSIPLQIALRSALLIIQSFTQTEARSASQGLSIADGNDRNQRHDTETTFAPMVLNEALLQQCQVPLELESEEGGRASKTLLPKSTHHSLTTVSEQIDRFIVEADSAEVRQPCVAWFCDNNIVFTCRIGSSTSRYRGQIEVILRSPTIRLRSLIPIPGKLCLDDPELPLPLLGAPRSEVPTAARLQADKDRRYSCPEEYTMKIDSSEILNHAQALIDRFDAMFSDEPDTEEPPPSEYGNDSISSGTSRGDAFDVLASLEFGSSVQTDTTGVLTTSSIPEPPQEVSSANTGSQGDASVASNVSAMEELQGPGIIDWFITAFGWDEDDANLQPRLDGYLPTAGLSIATTGATSSTFQNYQFRESKELYYDEKLERAISILDRTATCNTYKFGLLYFRKQPYPTDKTASSEEQLLGALYCSPAFHKFASEIGSVVPTSHLKYYSAGLDVSEYESDGRYTCAWLAPDETSSVIFHVVNLMPSNLNGRKSHIGNDNVLIIFVEETSDIDSILTPQRGAGITATHGPPVVSGHFDFATIFVKHMPRPGLLRITCRIRAGLPKELDDILSDFAGEDLVPERHAADFVRSLAMRVDLCCRTIIDGLPPPTNCLERCRIISETQRYAVSESM